MSIGDPVLLVPYFRYNFTTITSSGNVDVLCGDNASRVALIIGMQPGPAQYMVGPASRADQTTGIVLTSNQTETFLFHDYGPMVGQSWTGVCTGSGTKLCVWEVMYYPGEAPPIPTT